MPVSISGFSRYDIYPDGKVVDKRYNKVVLLNRHGNFVMWPDVEVLGADGKPIPHLENMRRLIKQLVKQGVEGFTEELADSHRQHLDAFLPAAAPSKSEGDIKMLHDLRQNLKKKTDAVLNATSSDFQIHQERFRLAQAELDDFKSANPYYYKWKPYFENVDVAKLAEEEAELRRQMKELDQQILEVREQLKGVLGLYGYTRTSNFGL